MLISPPQNVNAFSFFLFCFSSLYLIQSQWRPRGYFLPRTAVCCLQREALRLEVTSSDRYAKCCLSDNICTDLYTMLASSCTQGQCGWVSVPGMQKQHVVLFSCHALSPYVACSASVVNCSPYLPSHYFIPGYWDEF